MDKLPFHTTQKSAFNVPPPIAISDLPILSKTAAAYKTWHECLIHFPRLDKYTLGIKIDNLFCNLIELLLEACHTNREAKLEIITTACVRLDALKYFAKIAWELKAMDNKNYACLSVNLNEIGKMLGGWKKQAQNISK
ncbi:four helix bundle protein [Patescibacteria group bacterium]|nr:four helix bundle protein [Patescibacteria group bacterium]